MKLSGELNITNWVKYFLIDYFLLNLFAAHSAKSRASADRRASSYVACPGDSFIKRSYIRKKCSYNRKNVLTIVKMFLQS